MSSTSRHAHSVYQGSTGIKNQTDPAKHAKLREIGLQPQVLMCRTEHSLDAELRQKLSMFCSVAPDAVIEFPRCRAQAFMKRR
jgi:CTP synthase (UTP-ammonia lyase)